MIWLLAIPALLLIGLLVVDFQISAPGYKGEKADYFDGKKFINPDKLKGRGLYDMLKWALTGKRGPWQQIYRTDIEFPPASTFTNLEKLSVTFVNHATFLIQVNGLNILTDPIWSRRASPYSWIGPKRMRPPGIRFDDLPDIDLVLISHNHYDHLDLPTVKRLKKEHDPLFITPLGVGYFLNKNGIPNTVDMGWWDEHLITNEFIINSVPAQHFSGRGVFDRDLTLWCGYVLESSAGTVYFAGDTAYGSFFTDIGNAFDIDISLIPIGAYKPRWFMQPIHTDPGEAVQIHCDVQSNQSIGTHFGTFPLADEGMDEPRQDLAKAIEKQGLSKSAFFTLKEGTSFSYEGEKDTVAMAGE
jgi:L-ascorbate metabolism protein UlaG (beta-lactamase superfamily)